MVDAMAAAVFDTIYTKCRSFWRFAFVADSFVPHTPRATTHNIHHTPHSNAMQQHCVARPSVSPYSDRTLLLQQQQQQQKKQKIKHKFRHFVASRLYSKTRVG